MRAALLAGAMVLLGSCGGQTPPQATLVIATATKGGTYHPLGVRLGAILEGMPERPIGRAVVRTSAGSGENVTLLAKGDADVAFVAATEIAARKAEQPELSLLARLYTGTVQVVVHERGDATPSDLQQLAGLRTYVGRPNSGTLSIANGILDAVGVSVVPVQDCGYAQAAERVASGEIDAAIFASGTPTTAVASAMASGRCRLLDLAPHVEAMQQVKGLVESEVPANLYERQPQRIASVGSPALLLCRKTLSDTVTHSIATALVDHADELVRAHAKAQDLRIEHAFEFPTKDVGVLYHDGVDHFREEDAKRVRILTGSLNGRYHRLGRGIAQALRQRRIPARAVHTDGSIQNLGELSDPERGPMAIAFVQYDAALARAWAAPGATGQATPLRRLRRIATLHPEPLHVIVRADLLPPRLRDRPTIGALLELDAPPRITLGPRGSGTQELAKEVFRHHGLSSRWPDLHYRHLSVPRMVSRMHSGELDVACFASGTPSEALRSVLASREFRLLGVDHRSVAQMTRGGTWLHPIPPQTYGCQGDDKLPVTTVATRAAIVALEDAEAPIADIVRTIFESAGPLRIEGGPEGMAERLTSLELHPEAEAYYERAGLRPAPPSINWLGAISSILAILLVLTGAYKGALKLRRDHTANRFGRDVFQISVEASETESVHKLVALRAQIRERVRRRWWQAGEIDKSRWRTLEDVIQNGIRVAKDNLARSLVAEIRVIAGDPTGTVAKRAERMEALKERTWRHFEAGELDESQHTHLLDVFEESLKRKPKKRTSTRASARMKKRGNG